MSQENVLIMRAALEAFARNDVSGFLRLMDPEVEFEPQLAAVEGTYVGHDGIRAFFTDAFENLEVVQLRDDDMRDLGNRVLAFVPARIGGRGSGIETETFLALVATFRDGRIVHLKDYGEKEAALEAVALSE
jgi:ketosteroid isomerase-like protein